MSLMSAAPLQDETIRGRLFVALNGFTVFALLKAIACRFATQSSKDSVLFFNAIGRCCVVHLFPTRLSSDLVKFSLAILDDVNPINHREVKKFGCGGWI